MRQQPALSAGRASCRRWQRWTQGSAGGLGARAFHSLSLQLAHFDHVRKLATHLILTLVRVLILTLVRVCCVSRVIAVISNGGAEMAGWRSRDATHDEPVSCDRTLPLEPTSCSRADESRLCARYHIPKAITTAPAKPNQVMAASISGPFHFRPAQ